MQRKADLWKKFHLNLFTCDMIENGQIGLLEEKGVFCDF